MHKETKPVRYLFSIIMVMLLVLGIPQTGTAADTTNCAVSYYEGDTWIVYYGTVTFGSAGGTDNAYSQAMSIADVSNVADQYAYIQIWFTDGVGTEDANGTVQFSNSTTATTFSGTADANLDQIQVTVKTDTIGVVNGALDGLRGNRYMRLKLDGQTGNPNGAVCNYYIKIPKAAGAPKRGVAGSKNTS